jgi:hypothetical protein
MQLTGKSNQYEEHVHKLLEKDPLPFSLHRCIPKGKRLTEAATISCFGPADTFFHKLFGGLMLDKDNDFDNMCQALNNLLIHEFGKCMLLHKSNKEEANCIQFNEHVIKFLQLDTFSALCESSCVPKFPCNPGI